MASLWKLPVLYVCEDNLYNEYTHRRETTAGDMLARAAAFGIPTAEVDGQDVLAVKTAAAEAVTRARRGGGPTFLLCRTYRFRGHHVGDVDRSYYRGKAEEDEWQRERDPIAKLARRLLADGARPDQLDATEESAASDVQEGLRFALDAPFPDPDEVTMHVYP